MNFFDVTNSLIAYIQDNLLFAAVAALLLAVVAYRYTKFFLIVFFIALFAAGVFFMISSISSTGTAYKKDLTREKSLPQQNTGDMPVFRLPH